MTRLILIMELLAAGISATAVANDTYIIPEKYEVAFISAACKRVGSTVTVRPKVFETKAEADILRKGRRIGPIVDGQVVTKNGESATGQYGFSTETGEISATYADCMTVKNALENYDKRQSQRSMDRVEATLTLEATHSWPLKINNIDNIRTISSGMYL